MDNKYMKIGLLFICLSLMTLGLFAQNPGLGGKKFSIYYDFVFTPSFGNAIPYDASEKLSSNKKSFWNFIRYRHEVDLEYAISRKWGIGLDYFYHKGGYGGVDRAGNFNNGNETYNPFYSRNFQRHGFGVFVRKYRVKLSGYRSDEGALAPLGYYWEPRIFVSLDKYQIKANADYFDGNDLIYTNQQAIRLGASFKVGRHILLFDRLMIDVGLEFGLVSPTKFDRIGRADMIDILLLESTKHPYEQILVHHMFGFHIGVGYVLF
jgi:hypothetical protein